MRALFEDLSGAAGSLTFAERAGDRTVVARTESEVVPALAQVDQAVRSGRWAWGYVAYEAAPGLDPALTVRAPGVDDPPLVWFVITERPAAAPADVGDGRDPQLPPVDWADERTDAELLAAVEQVRDHIAAGGTYQCNLTTRIRAHVAGDTDPQALYRRLVGNQHTPYAALLELGPYAIASASPELFFERRGDSVLTRPMKGTAARGRSSAEDEQARHDLRVSRKERAENIIVVDLLRNDLSRIAASGSVDVPVLCRAERYATVWQLTSDVTARVPADTTLVDLFRALFPSGSVTGAPKPRTMQLIRDLETSPRGVYCGAVGWVAPPGEPVRARFSVAIRTAVHDRRSGVVTYGTGGGITWDSQPAAELAEQRLKARILTADRPRFGLFETMACLPGGIRHRAAHLDRLAASAAYFGRHVDRDTVAKLLDNAVDTVGPAGLRLRLTLDPDGTLSVQPGPLPVARRAPVVLAIDDEPVDTTGPWPFHKTTLREPYDSRKARHPGVDDVVLVNERGHVTETTIANIAALVDGTWCTPPVADGCLPGVERAHLVATGHLVERSLTPEDLRRAEALDLISSLRGRRRAVLEVAGAGRCRGGAPAAQ